MFTTHHKPGQYYVYFSVVYLFILSLLHLRNYWYLYLCTSVGLGFLVYLSILLEQKLVFRCLSPLEITSLQCFITAHVLIMISVYYAGAAWWNLKYCRTRLGVPDMIFPRLNNFPLSLLWPLFILSLQYCRRYRDYLSSTV